MHREHEFYDILSSFNVRNTQQQQQQKSSTFETCHSIVIFTIVAGHILFSQRRKKSEHSVSTVICLH